MKNQIKKQEIAQLLSKFMAGETSIAEEETLAQYFRTHEVDDEWAEYKEMFALCSRCLTTVRWTLSPKRIHRHS